MSALFQYNVMICSSTQKHSNNKINKNSHPAQKKYKTIKQPVRSKPLYENCYMEANDGDLLCTCSRQKAEW